MSGTQEPGTPRGALSLSGNKREMIAAGGWSGLTVLKTVELYRVATNAWKGVAPLRQARGFPASCVLSTGKMFCFYGGKNIGEYVSSIESLQLGSEEKWHPVEVNPGIVPSFNMGALQYEGQVVLLGGSFFSSFNAYTLTEEDYSAFAFDGKGFTKL